MPEISDRGEMIQYELKTASLTQPLRTRRDYGEEDVKRKRLTEVAREKQAARSPSGMYGYTRRVQSDCETAVRKLNRLAQKISKKAMRKDHKVVDFLQTHSKRSKSSTARILIAAIKDSLPKFASEELPETTIVANLEEKQAARYGMYGFRERTIKVGLEACTEIRKAAGKIASDLHQRRSDRYDRITGFFKEHNKTTKCSSTGLILSCYPDSTIKLGSEESSSTKIAREYHLGDRGTLVWEDE